MEATMPTTPGGPEPLAKSRSRVRKPGPMAPRSRTGCLTCRQRKLKCSEERPVCAQCNRAQRECIPSSGITFRHQQNPSMNGRELGDGSLKSFYGYKETFGKGAVWVDIPSNLKFVNTTNPYEDDEVEVDATALPPENTTVEDDRLAAGLAALAEDATNYEEGAHQLEYDLNQPAYPAYPTHGLEALSAVANQVQNIFAPPSANMTNSDEQTHSGSSPLEASPQHAQAIPSHNNLDFILNPASAMGSIEGNIDPQLHSDTPTVDHQPQQHTPTHVRTFSYVSSFGRPRLRSKGHQDRQPCIEDAELAFLVRDFSERAGLWMDLFDLGLFFATTVPVLAVQCPLLLYSCAALSAKCLARVDGRRPVMGGQTTVAGRSRMEFWPGEPLSVEGWVHKAREYYDLAVSLLRQALAGATRPSTSSLTDFISETMRSTTQGFPLPTTGSDELLAATATLCIYEFLDASGSEWSQHLDGAKSLFDISMDRMVPLTRPPSPVSATAQICDHLGNNRSQHIRGLTQGRKAVFWNFARQDMLSAYINNTSTRLDTSDLAMWRSAGLKMTPAGFLCPSNPQHPDYTSDDAMTDDTICNALIWLLMKLVNFIAAGDDMPAMISPLGLGVRQHELLEYWDGLDEQLRVWFEGLPPSFHATAKRTADPGTGIEEKWFPRPMCASAMQSYHFARIQLLHNRPQVSTATFVKSAIGRRAWSGTSLATRHASYVSILQQSRTHAKEIVAIGLGRSDEGTRIHSLQPLWTAGLVLGGANDDGDVSVETESWRRAIINQLRSIESDMGWASEYRVQSLLELWELPSNWGVDESAHTR